MSDEPAEQDTAEVPAEPTFWRSPHFTDAQLGAELNFEQKVAVFADRVRSWQLDVAERVVQNEPHSGFAVLSTLISYFEMIAKHREGFIDTGQSGDYFREGVEWVWERWTGPPEVRRKVAERLWKAARNGLYHDGLTGAGIVLSGEIDVPMQAAVSETGELGEVYINPAPLAQQVQVHFSGYILRLLNPLNGTLRDNFEKRFDWRESGGEAPSSPSE